MSKNIDQVFIANPITSNASTDLMYFGQSPYTTGDDAAMTFANFSVQFGAPYTAAALTKVNDTNVTLTLGGTPATALLHAASITAGWTGTLSGARGGTGVANTGLTINLGTATTGYVLTSDTSGNATWQPSTGSGSVSPGTTNELAWYAANGSTVSGLATSNNGLLVTSSGGVPSIGNSIGADIVVHGVNIGLGKSSINNNTGVGTNVLSEITTGNQNTGLGFQALSNLTNGAGNTGVGYIAVTGDGNGNTGVGATSLNQADGSDNTAIGSGSFASLSSGTFNTACGAFTGLALGGSTTLDTGNNNTLLGTASGVDAGDATGTIAIGYLAVANSSTGATAGDNGPGITIGSTGGPVGFRGDGTIYSGGTGRGYWRPNLNGTHYLMPCFIDGTLTVNASMITDTNGSPILSATMTDGQIIIGSSAGLPVAATLTQGTGITITNANNSITIAATGGASETWTDEAVSFNALAGNGYFITAALTATLPSSPTIGQKIDFIVDTTGSFVIQAAAGQAIRLGSSISAAAGTATNHARGDTISLLYSDSSSTWIANAAIGNAWTVI
jgi:hypothetical protein